MAENARGVKRRLIINATLELTSPTHFGGSDPNDIQDMPIARDAITGKPILYGTTLAGLLRAVVSNRISSPDDKEPPQVFGFFGGSKDSKDDGEQSAFIVNDAIAEGEKHPTDIRDGVSINHKTGVAQKGAKFDMELIRAGTRFPLHFELVLDGSKDAELISCLLTCMDALEKGEVLLGARNRKGFGRCATAKIHSNNSRWKVQDFDVTTREGLLQWAVFEREVRLPKGCPENKPSYFESTEQFLQSASPNGIGACTIHQNHPAELSVTIHLKVSASILIKSGGHSPDEADATHLTTFNVKGKRTPIISGTSLGGLLRARALKIANTFDSTENKAIAGKMVNSLFGNRDTGADVKPKAGRLYVEERPIHDGKPLRHTRVMIDRWTGGALEHHLFEADAQFGGKTDIVFRIVSPDEPEIGLMLCVVKDLFTGDLPIGSESAIGRGRLLGETAEITYNNTWTLHGNENRTFTVKERGEQLQVYVDKFLAKFGHKKNP